MPTVRINANESSPHGGNGNIPSNTYDKVVCTKLEESVQGKTVIREEITYDILENQRKKYKTHRNIGEIENKFINLKQK
eukprot:scaffold4441_cov194-Ochromonas_danica.AAC.1